MIINVSTGFQYHTQRNNKVIPNESCNVTSMAMGLIYSRIPIKWPEGIQDEDWLNGMLQTAEAYKAMERIAPWAVGKRNPREVHAMLQWVANKVAGYECDELIYSGSIEDIISQLTKKYAVVVSGKFTPYGHVVCVVGVSSHQDLSKPTEPEDVDIGAVEGFILDDPWGDVTLSYQGEKGKLGNDVTVGYAYFNQTVVTCGRPDKMFHMFKRKGE